MKEFLRLGSSSLRYVIEILQFWRKSLNKDPWVLSRCACLGNDVYVRLSLSLPQINIQKGRVDFLLKAIANPKLIPKPHAVYKYLQRKDIIGLLFQQKKISLLTYAKSPALIYMDSYAELTDQLFLHRENQWMFCANYTDMQIDNKDFWNEYICEGLLPLDEIKKYYELLFKHIRSLHDKTPIVFIHFPTKLDSREKFKTRGLAITNALSELKDRFDPFYEFKVDDDVIDFNENDAFPYHYNEKTYANLVNQITRSKVLDLIKLKTTTT